MSTAPISQEDPVIVLTDLETRICGHVLACCSMFQLSTQVRIAGGWVRDKLLGLESQDIDFALDNMTGEEFASKLSEYLKSIGEKISSVGVIKVNPDQSKHLATATMKVLDVSIDINNFREEIYLPGSRIPEISMSSAKEDALRRDFTLNSLFYNIHTKKVEDYVDGLNDLRGGLLRTPRDPFKTFSDDPLRILRAARFAGRFGYQVHESIDAAARTPSIQADLATKVSRERMGIEVGKMLQTDKAAHFSLDLLCNRWQLRRIIFEVPDNFAPAPAIEIGEMPPLQPIEPRNAPTENASVTDVSLQAMKLADVVLHRDEANYSLDECYTLMLASFFIPYYGYRTELKKGKFNSVIWYIVRESLKLPQRDAQLASDLLTHAHHLIRASYLHAAAFPDNTTTTGVDGTPAGAASSSSSSSSPPISTPAAATSSSLQREHLQILTGGILRQTGVHSRITLHLADIIVHVLPQLIVPGVTSVFDQSLGFEAPPAAAIGREELVTQLQRYTKWIQTESQLLQLPIWDMKPLASGTEVCSVLGISAKGPHVGAIINKMMEWQMIHMEQLLPLYTHSTTAAAASSSSSSSGLAPNPTSATTDAAALAPVKEACFAWLKTQNLATATPEKARK